MEAFPVSLPCYLLIMVAWDSYSGSLKETYTHVVKGIMANPCWLI